MLWPCLAIALPTSDSEVMDTIEPFTIAFLYVVRQPTSRHDNGTSSAAAMVISAVGNSEAPSANGNLNRLGTTLRPTL